MTGKATHNSTFAIGGVSCFADCFVVAKSLYLRMNFCGKNPAHRKSAKRYASNFIETSHLSIVSSCNTSSKSSIKKLEVSPLEVTKTKKDNCPPFGGQLSFY